MDKTNQPMEEILKLSEQEFSQLFGEVFLADNLGHHNYSTIMLRLNSHLFKLRERMEKTNSAILTYEPGRILSLCVHNDALYDCGSYGVYNTLTNERIDIYEIWGRQKVQFCGTCLSMTSKTDGLYCTTVHHTGQEWVVDEERNESLENKLKLISYKILKLGEVERVGEVDWQAIEYQRKVTVQGDLLRNTIKMILT